MKNLSQHNKTQRLTGASSFDNIEKTNFFAEILGSGLSLRVKVTGRSMTPFLSGGEVVTIKQVPASDMRRGDLIFFESSHGFPVLHRIVRKKRSVGGAHIFQTRGDALMAFDEEISGDRILGKVFQIERSLPSGKTLNIDMNSLFYRSMNLLIALLGLFKTETYFFLLAAVAKII